MRLMNDDAPLAGSPRQPVQGLIAILDALGAATYSESEIERFLESRELVLNKLNERAEAGKIDKKRLKVFTFNDTVVIVYLARRGQNVRLEDVTTFAFRLRAFMIQSLEHQILFRGSISIGPFYGVDDDTNTVMGPAVSDAAAWYDKPDWIGISATPHATIYIDSLLESSKDKYKMIIVDHEVPLKGRPAVRVKTINWPKAFYVSGLRPYGSVGARAALLEMLAKHQAPLGTEAKYYNTIAFFDHICREQKLSRRAKRR
jgi:hypothetical protein